MRNLKALIPVLALFFAFNAAKAQSIDLYKDAIMPGGPFEGQALDTSKIRGLVLLNDSNNILPENLSRTHVYVANVSHDGKRYVARINAKAPNALSFIYEKFTTMMGGHADLVYGFNKKMPLELIYEILDGEQEKDFSVKKLQKPIELSHVLLTAEAVKVVGDKTGLAEGGIQNKFAMAYRMTSIPERLIGPVIVEGRKTTVFEVPFDKTKIAKSLFDTLETQSKIGMSENYNLITNNCITSAIRGVANGLTAQEEASIERELSEAFLRIGGLSRRNMSEKELNETLKEFTEILGSTKKTVKHGPITDKAFFLEWLSKQQLDMANAHICRRFFN